MNCFGLSLSNHGYFSVHCFNTFSPFVGVFLLYVYLVYFSHKRITFI